ncbi:LOW QUALITY PROTEIN: inositol oxygenase 1-like [Herrania umbratica]|uniref:Inositol oxygenase n=1 Tax=Herrania umbratica TaxID=108875 RepID=A0A6J0ZMW1_9ROSI|nr:LOW QUALITY PROTEIN: inositol oxygenase 1-like [Herrania umbratica]
MTYGEMPVSIVPRDYEKESLRREIVLEIYRKNHINPTYEFAKKKKEEYEKLDKAVMSIWECCELLNEFVDESDPDLDEPQLEHLLQSAEAIQKDYPDDDWLHLTALIDDLGKVLLHPSFGAQPQWAVVGDTFPLGYALDEAIVHHHFFKENPDYQNPALNTELGVYTENSGPDNVTMSWGHDEYMYLVAKGNNATLPPAGLFIIRFHSFYALHRSGSYTYLMNDEDKEMMTWLEVKYDLYSKSKEPYYPYLIQKHFPEKLKP